MEARAPLSRAYPLTAAQRRATLRGLEQLTGSAVHVVAQEPLGHDWAPVTRLTLDVDLTGRAPGASGSSVVVKTRRVDKAGHGGPPYLRREAAGLQVAAASGVTPRLLYVDDDAGVVVQSDLGRWPTLEELLLGADPAAAFSAVVGLAEAMARLHAATWDAADDWQAALSRFAPRDVSTGAGVGTTGPAEWAEVVRAADDLGLPSAHQSVDDVDLLCRHLAEPAGWGAVVHHDLNPTNVMITDAGARLVDLEGAGYRQVGVDACTLHFPFPHYSPHWSVLPASCAAAADRVYRDTLARLVPELEPAEYDRMITIGAGIALTSRTTRLRLIASEDQSAHDSWRRRAQLVQQIGVFVTLARRAGVLTELADWFAELADAMSRRWTDATTPPPPMFPAFARPQRSDV